jgi:hypothetical protein
MTPNNPNPKPARPINYAGQPIGPGEGYGGREEHIPLSWKPRGSVSEPASAAPESQRETVTEKDMRAVLSNGSLTLSEAAKRLGLLTGAERTTCYRCLRPDGRFARHLHVNGTRLSWS